MPKGTLFALLFLVAVTPLHARLGETEAELAKRYGKSILRAPATIHEQGRTYPLGDNLHFRSDQWAIIALLINGKCESISISKKGEWTEEQFSTLLRANAGKYAWREVPKQNSKLRREWVRDDGTTAVWLMNSYLTFTTPVREKAIEAIKKRAKEDASKLPNF